MFDYLITNVINGILAIILLLAGYKIFDWMTNRINFYEELENNNTSVAVILAAFFVGLSFIIGAAAY